MEKLIEYLQQHQIDYEMIEHSTPIHTAQEGADYFQIEIGQTAPTLILKTEKGYYSLIISGDHGRVNLDIIKDLLNVNEIRLAKPKEVEEVTGSKVGSVSLINPELPTLFDKQLYRYSYIYGGTGVPQTTLKIQPKDVEKLNHIVGYI